MSPTDASTRLWQFCAAGMQHRRRPWLLAVTGTPGSGKSTLTEALVRRARDEGNVAITLSLDDFYLPLEARQALARQVHPLWLTRGVPGTHDIALLRHVLERLAEAKPARPALVPRFDKDRDTRRPLDEWVRVTEPPRLIVLEGWCLGIAPQGDEALRLPLNELERSEDPDAALRLSVNRQVATYLSLWRNADARVRLTTPDWDTVCRQRRHAEADRRRRHAPRAMDEAALNRFLAHYERLCRQAIAHPPDADLIFPSTAPT